MRAKLRKTVLKGFELLRYHKTPIRVRDEVTEAQRG